MPNHSTAAIKLDKTLQVLFIGHHSYYVYRIEDVYVVKAHAKQYNSTKIQTAIEEADIETVNVGNHFIRAVIPASEEVIYYVES